MSNSTKDLQELVPGGGQALPTERSAESSSVSLVPDTDYDTQSSVSLLEASTVGYAKTGSSQRVPQFVASESVKEPVHGSKDAGSGTVCFKHLPRHESSHTQGTAGTEESELDTQYLQNTFQVSKRRSFALFSKPGDPQKECVTACASSLSLRGMSPKVTSESEQNKEKQGHKESETGHVRAGTATVGLPLLHPEVSPITSSVKTDHRKTLSEKHFEKHTLSTEKAMGNETVVQSTVRTISQNNRKNDCQNTDSGSINEVSSSGDNFQGQRGRNRGTKLNTVLPLGLMHPGVCKPSFPVDDYKYLEIKKQEGETVGADFSPCLFSDKLEQSMGSDHIFQVCSETPDDLLDDVEIQENTSFSDIMEKSAVFNGSVQRREFSRSPSPLTHASLNRSLRRGPRRLESSEESDCCEEEDLPCFQHLLGRVSNTSELTKTRQSSVVTQRLSEKATGTQVPLNHGVGDYNNNNEVILVEASQEHHLSEDAKFSGSLFSPQHSVVQDSAANAASQDPSSNPPSKQMSCQPEDEEDFQSDKELISADEDMGTCLDNDDQEEDIIPDSGSFVYTSLWK
ncbi:Breast cancer type 1 susceptibility protein homolog [Lemmus lemmus]